MHSLNNRYESVPCAVCGSRGFRIVHPALARESTDFVSEFKSSADGPLTEQVVACTDCGLEFVSPRLNQTVILDAYREGADERFVSQVKARERTFAGALRALEQRIKPGRLLDVGAAGGSFPYVAKTRGWDASGCEPNKWMCQWGRTHYDIDLRPGTLLEQHYPDQTFDVVTLWDVLEHDGDPGRLVDECHRVLRPGGLFVVNYPDVGSWVARAMGRRWPFYLSGHLYYFTRRTVRELLSRRGFEVVEVRPHYQWLEFDYLLLRSEVVGGAVSRLLRRATSGLGLSRVQVPYWIGQTFVLARRH